MKKKLTFFYVVTVAVMAAATVVEKSRGTGFVAEYIYGAWWFSLLWAVLCVAGIVYFLRKKVRRWNVVALHLSFVIILLGALLTHVSARSGLVHLRTGEEVNSYLTEDMEAHPLPFTVRLDSFTIRYHEGTMAPADYLSSITVTDGGRQWQAGISMNRIFSHRQIRLYQSSYDEDGQGSILALNSDPWGIPVTYAGYALLFVSLLWMLVDPEGAYRRLLRSIKTENPA